MRKVCVAMLLAGGKGSRLGVLTKKIAKPAVHFGGKYRIIDFTLSNCYNSGIDTVGVLTQYQPLELNSYIGIGSSWDLDRQSGGVTVLPPFEREIGGHWYKGTADAIYQNITFVDQYNPQYALILSGDHVYKMDYSLMLNYHKEKNADFTIAVIEIPWEEAGNFGIMNTDEDGRIIEFEEKPAMPKSNYASMGIYVANWGLLKEYLEEDEGDINSDHDFGKNIIPKMLNSGRRLYAYPFKGYWRDVGTIDSLWEAHMDLFHSKPGLDLYDHEWRIYSKNPAQPAHYVSPTARISSSLINEGCFVFGSVFDSILFPGVHVAEGVEISNSIIMPDVKIGPHTIVHKTIIGESAIIQDYCRIGFYNDDHARCRGITVIESNITVPRGAVIPGNVQVHEENLHEFYIRNRGEVK